MAMAGATMQAATRAMPLGLRSPSPRAATPASHRSSIRNSRQAAARTMSSASAGEREDERSGEDGEQDHRPTGDLGAVQAAGEQPDEHDGGDRREHVEHQRGERVAERRDRVEPADGERIEREERRPRLELEVRDVRGIERGTRCGRSPGTSSSPTGRTPSPRAPTGCPAVAPGPGRRRLTAGSPGRRRR